MISLTMAITVAFQNIKSKYETPGLPTLILLINLYNACSFVGIFRGQKTPSSLNNVRQRRLKVQGNKREKMGVEGRGKRVGSC